MISPAISPTDLLAVQRAISAELAESTKPTLFKIRSVRKESEWLVLSLVRLDSHRVSAIVDESLEGSSAWWPEPQKGGGEVFLVRSEEDEIWLDSLWGQPPAAGGTITLYPPAFLEHLLAIWRSPSWMMKVSKLLASLPAPGVAIAPPLHLPPEFAWMRSGQKKALSLPDQRVGYLWGPPGTGKTTALGILVATYLVQRPSARVLVLATTNSAVDQALIAVDTALETLRHNPADPHSPRSKLRRIGHNLEVSRYTGRRHLIPPKNPQAIQALMDHQKKCPPESDATKFAHWQTEDQRLRQHLRVLDLEMLKNARVAAMTTTRAAFGFQMLSEMPAPDLLVIDEASQVSLAYALALMPLSMSVLFAGDPEQLAPIVKVDTQEATQWLAQSPFAWRNRLALPEATVFLDEQSRMAAPICDAVGKVFYEGRLKVCARAGADSQWQRDRRSAQGSGKGLEIVPIIMEGHFSAAWGGPVREESADSIVQLVKTLLHRIEPDDVQILTPFRAQRKMIKSKLKQADITGLRVTTVHRAQGSERRVILFDPVQGSGNFFAGATGRRLINVALSRAQAQAYLFLSSGDLSNDTLGDIAKHTGFKNEAMALPLMCELGSHPQFPNVLTGKVFGYLGAAIKFKSITGLGDSVKVEAVRGRELSGRFNLSSMRQKCCDRKSCPIHKGPNAPRCVQ